MEQNMILIRDPKTFYFNFDRSKDIDENLKSKTEFAMNSNECFVEDKKNNLIEQLFLNINMETILMNMESSQTIETHIYVFNFLYRLDLRSSNKHVKMIL